jgi:hypothetical protein
MSVHTSDIFHCQKCGAVVYQSHGRSAPNCCGETMACAVADGVKETPKDRSAQEAFKGAAADGREHVLLQEVAELSTCCRLKQGDSSEYAELARRLRSVYGLLLGQFDDKERAGDLAKVLATDARYSRNVDQFRNEHRELLEFVDRLINDLRRGDSGFHGWSEVCQRVDSFAADMRSHERAKAELIQIALEEDLGTPD